ncbi:MAG: DUF2298 domain-containing protein [Chloroflexota bacterium]
MFFDWIGREGGALLSWWLLTLLAGVAVYPLFFRLMGMLPSRGYALARAAGLMLIGFVFWILNILGLLSNTPGSTVLAALIVLVIGLVSYATWKEREPILPWLRANWSHILAAELLFAVMFVGWATVRAMNPSLVATEKPMEMAFLNGIRRSATFPPHDPWMSGYAISYYHFGYIIMATLANLSGVSSGIAFNLALPLLFALTGLGAFGIAYDLVVTQLRHFTEKQKNEVLARQHYPSALAIGVLAAVFVVVMGNLGTAAVEIPYQTCTASPAYLKWMNLDERDAYPAQDAAAPGNCGTTQSLDPANWNYWWWFRYSRVVRDTDLTGQPLVIQPITEFPQFSFILSDMHPHVLALPFAMLIVGLSFNLVMRKRDLYVWEVVLYALFTGGMIFLNSWDAVYFGLVLGAEAVRRLTNNGTGQLTGRDWLGVVRFGIALVGLTAILYLPFFIGFRSQAGGIIPNVLWPTQFNQFFIMFGPFLVILGAFLIVEARRAGQTFNARLAVQAIAGIIGFLVLAFLILAITAWFKPEVRQAAFQVADESGGFLGVIAPVLLRRLQGVVTEGVLLLAMFAVIGRLFAREPRKTDGTPDSAPQVITYSAATGFVLLIIAAGAVLTLLPDFVYLRDGFGVRINTVFKLYYQGWLLWSVASAYALWSVLYDPAWEPVATPLRLVFGALSVVLIALCMIYPVDAIRSRAFKEGGHLDPGDTNALTLDGGASLAMGPDDYNAIQCLASVAKADNDVVAEATKANIAYNITGNYSRVSGLTGIPTLIGWDNHERQWRGETFDSANLFVDAANNINETRADAIAKLYNSTNIADALAEIRRYNISYIYIGPQERRDFSEVGLAKFDGLPTVCHFGNVDVYAADAVGLQAPKAAGN